MILKIEYIKPPQHTQSKKLLKNAEFNTSFVDMHPELTDYDDELPPEVIAAAISAAIAAHEGI